MSKKRFVINFFFGIFILLLWKCSKHEKRKLRENTNRNTYIFLWIWVWEYKKREFNCSIFSLTFKAWHRLIRCVCDIWVRSDSTNFFFIYMQIFCVQFCVCVCEWVSSLAILLNYRLHHFWAGISGSLESFVGVSFKY